MIFGMDTSVVSACCLLAIGPSIVLSVFAIFENPRSIILLLASAICWQASIEISWLLAHPFGKGRTFHDVFTTVVINELMRCAIYLYTFRRELNTEKRVRGANNINHKLGFISGLGFGIICGAHHMFAMEYKLASMETLISPQDYRNYLSLIASMVLLYTILHTFWGMIVFAGLHYRDVFLVMWGFWSHLLAFINMDVDAIEEPEKRGNVYLIGVNLLMTAVIAVRVEKLKVKYRKCTPTK